MTRIVLCALLLVGCVDTVTEATTIELAVAGSDASAPFEGRRGAIVTLDRADVAFGPLYLCAGFTAGELCDEALAEWRDAVVVDALDPTVREVGEMNALTGTARSYMFDYGITSLLTQEEPLVLPAAGSLGPASAWIEGRADVDGQSFAFTARVRVEQGADVEQGVPVVRSGESSDFEAPILEGGRSRLEVRFDPREWLASADFAGLTEDAACTLDGAPLVCSGSVEQSCNVDGTVLETRDCSMTGQACLRGIGCAETITFDSGDQINRALRQGLEAGSRPAFTLGD